MKVYSKDLFRVACLFVKRYHLAFLSKKDDKSRHLFSNIDGKF